MTQQCDTIVAVSRTRGDAALPLRTRTPCSWAGQVLRHPLALLNDHAHLEKKAAANALELLGRRPENGDKALDDRWVSVMTSVARDEIEHLGTVVRLLTRRGGQLSNVHRNPYAAALRRLVRLGAGPQELVDRLLVSALIELRSCERFSVLADHDGDRELSKLYRGLSASEQGHYLAFVNFARGVGQEKQVAQRWGQMLEAEAQIMSAQSAGPRMHSGVL